MVPIDRVEELPHLFVRPIGSENKKLKGELHDKHPENGAGHMVVDILPLHIQLVVKISFNRGPTMKQMDKENLIDFPDRKMSHSSFQEHPAQT